MDGHNMNVLNQVLYMSLQEEVNRAQEQVSAAQAAWDAVHASMLTFFNGLIPRNVIRNNPKYIALRNAENILAAHQATLNSFLRAAGLQVFPLSFLL